MKPIPSPIRKLCDECRVIWNSPLDSLDIGKLKAAVTMAESYYTEQPAPKPAPAILPVGTKVKIVNSGTGRYHFGGEVVTIAGCGTISDIPDLYWMSEGCGSWPRGNLEVQA